MKKKNLIRLVSSIFILTSIIWGYWWMTWILAVIFVFYFPLYFEVIFFGIIYDALYGLKINSLWNIDYMFTLVAIVLFIISFIIRRRLIIYE